MNDDEELCGVLGPAGQTCTMPKGHSEEMHAFMMEVTPDLGQLIESMLSRAEAAQVAYTKGERRNRWAFWVLVVAIVLNLTSAGINLLQGLS